MKAYHKITVIIPGEASDDDYDKAGNYTAPDSTTVQIRGASAPRDLTRNRAPEGSNNTDAFDFWFFTDDWSDNRIVVENGVRYTTQSFKKWNQYGAFHGVSVSGLAEVP